MRIGEVMRVTFRRVALVAAPFALAVYACGNEPPPPREPAPPAAAPAPEQAQEPTAAELPIAEDFAPEVERTITGDNYRAELDAIERELAAEPAPSPAP